MPSDPAESRSTRRAVAAAMVAAGLLAGSFAAPAMAQDPDARPRTEAEQEAARAALAATLDQAPDSPPSPDDPFIVVVETRDELAAAALARLDATAAANEANVRALEVLRVLEGVRAQEQDALAVRQRAIDELAAERKRMSDLTVQAFVTGSAEELDQYRALIEGDTTDPAAGRQIMFAQVLLRQEQVTEDAKRALRRARAKLRDVRETLAATEEVAERRLAVAAETGRRRVEAERAHLAAIDAADRAVTALRSAGARGAGPVPEEVAIIGVPRLNAEDLASWFAQSPYRPRVGTPMDDYARWFIDEGRTEGIRGDIAFAQAVLETGGFANNGAVIHNNFSGIGHCDTCEAGWTFPSPQMGVRAQIQLLKSYAVAKPEYVHPLVDRRLRGPAGCCSTWGDLTTRWATDPGYGPKVMFLYTAMVDHALSRRAQGQGFDDPPPIALP